MKFGIPKICFLTHLHDELQGNSRTFSIIQAVSRDILLKIHTMMRKGAKGATPRVVVGFFPENP